MDFIDKCRKIKNILKLPINITTLSTKQYHYRNKAVFHFDTPIQNNNTSTLSIQIASLLKEYANNINSNHFKFYGIMIKENCAGYLLLKLKIYANDGIFPYHLQIKILTYILDNVEDISSICYQITNSIKKQPNKYDPYYHLFGTNTLLDTVIVNKELIKYYISPDSFSRINHTEANHIYDKIFQLSHKNIKNNLICIGRDINIPSQILNPYFRNTKCITHCPLIYHDLTYNIYINDAFAYLKDKRLTHQFLNLLLTNNSTIVISAGRNGLNDQLIDLLVNSKYITQIIYISCNINSMKRNMELLLKSKYKINAIEVTDEFPNTIYTNIIISLLPNKNIEI